MRNTIRGYTDRPSAKPGETIAVHVSACAAPYRASLVRLRQLDHAPGGPGVKISRVESVPPRILQGQRQRTQVGNYIEITPVPTLPGSFTFFAFIQPLRLDADRQAIASIWDEQRKTGWVLEIVDGHLGMRIGDGRETEFVRSQWPLFEGIWYAIAGAWDAQKRTIHLAQQSRVTSANSRFGPVVPLDSSGTTTAQVALALNCANTPMLIGGLAEDAACSHVLACFNGKIDAPRLYHGVAGPELFANWAAGIESSDGVVARWDFRSASGQRALPLTGHMISAAMAITVTVSISPPAR